MKKLKKLLVALLAATLMVSALPLSASAAKIENEATPWWTNTNQITTTVWFEDDYGYVSPLVMGKLGVTYISMNLKVFCIDNGVDVYITQTSESASSNALSFEFVFGAVPGSTYRIDYTITTTRNGVDEIIHISDTATFSE